MSDQKRKWTAYDDVCPGCTTVKGWVGQDISSVDDARHWIDTPLLVPASVRQSMISDWFRCRRIFMFKYRFGLVHGRYKSAPVTGQLFHLAHSLRYLGRDPLAVERALYEVTERWKNGYAFWAESTGNTSYLDEMLEQFDQDVALARVMSEIHWGLHPLDRETYEVVGTELEVEAMLRDSINPIGGRLDLVLFRKKEPVGFIVVDHKTTSGSTADYMETVQWATQPRLYLLAFKYSEERQHPILGFLHNVVKKPTTRLKATQTWADYLDECRDWYAAKDDQRGELDAEGNPIVFKSGPRKGKVKPRWEWSRNADSWLEDPPTRSHLWPPEKDLLTEEFYRKILEVDRMCRAVPSLHNFSRTGVDHGICSNLYGRKCPYFKLCSETADHWQEIIDREFRLREEDELALPPLGGL